MSKFNVNIDAREIRSRVTITTDSLDTRWFEYLHEGDEDIILSTIGAASRLIAKDLGISEGELRQTILDRATVEVH